MRSTVARCPSSARACRSASGPGRSRTVMPRVKTLPSASTRCSPRVGSRTAADGEGGLIVTRPCKARMSSEDACSARSIIARTAGSPPSIAARSSSLSTCTCSSSASSISVESNRPPRLSGASCGWSGSTIAAPTTTSSSGLASTGNVLTLRSPDSSGETNRPPSTRRIGCVEMSESWSASARPMPASAGVWFSIRSVARSPLTVSSARMRSGAKSCQLFPAAATNDFASPSWRGPVGWRKRTSAVTAPGCDSAQSSSM